MGTATISKRQKERKALVDGSKTYGLEDAITLLKSLPGAKYVESLTLDLQLSVDPRSADGMMRSSVSLPNGTGTTVRVVCFCKGEGAKDAEASGADFVGGEELVKKVLEGWTDFDVVVAHPDMMREVSKLGRVLGPRGLMPSPKTGTVSMDVGRACQEVKKGKIEIRSDKTAGLHVACGKISFEVNQLVENVRAVILAVQDARPLSTKGELIRGIYISTDQSPSLRLNPGAIIKE